MIGIYNDDFLEYLKNHLGDDIKISSKNIICRCPWCEADKTKRGHNHLYISLDKPIFNCFKSECNTSGTIKKLINKISGLSNISKYINDTELKKLKNYKKIDDSNTKFKYAKDFKLPKITKNEFISKVNYLRSRLSYAPFDIKNIKGLILDVKKFIYMNNLYDKLSDADKKMLDFLHDNFIGFLLENKTKIVFRNIDKHSTFRYYKMILQDDMNLLDYYKITYSINESDIIVIGEGLFDIFNDYIFDYTGYKNSAFGYYCSLSQRFESLIKSIIFHDNIYMPRVVILSDGNISINYYKKLKRQLRNFCKDIKIFYNIRGNDFGDSFCKPEKIII